MYTGGYGKVLGEGDITALSSIVKRVGRFFSTNIVFCFADTIEGAWLYELASLLEWY